MIDVGDSGGGAASASDGRYLRAPTTDPESTDWPDTVSKVYHNLKVYIDRKYPEKDEATRYAMFAMAYTVYCDEKRSIINDSIELDANLDLQAVKRPFLALDKQTKFEKFDQDGQKLFRAYIEDDLRLLMKETSEKAKPGFWTEVWAHFLVTATATIIAIAVPILFALHSPDEAKAKLHELGEFLIKTFP